MVPGVVIIIILLSSTWLVKKTGQNLIVTGLYVIPSFIGTIVIMTVENKNMGTQVGLLISYYIVLSFWVAQTLAMSMISRNIGADEENCRRFHELCCMGGWKRYRATGFSVMECTALFYCLCSAYGLLVIMFLRWEVKRRNVKKDRLVEAGIREAKYEMLVHAFDDLTDVENPNFRYICQGLVELNE